MFIELNFNSDIPIYEQLKNEIIIGIAKRQLLPGDRLPSVRQLAGDIGINLHTVNKAYKQLEEAGFLMIHRQRGAIIHPDGGPKTDEKYKETIAATLRPIIANTICHGMNQSQFLEIIHQLYDSLGVDSDE